MIASCHDANNHITIPGFYDDVVEATPAERALMAKAPYDEAEYKKDLGISKALCTGEKGVYHQRANPASVRRSNSMASGEAIPVKVPKRYYLQRRRPRSRPVSSPISRPKSSPKSSSIISKASPPKASPSGPKNIMAANLI